MKFKPGESGNYQGRPKGTGYRQKLFDSLVAPNKEQLINTGIQLALAGNESMLKLFLDRLLPARPKEEPMQNVKALSGSLAEQANQTLSLITTGELTISQGRSLLEAIGAKAKLVEVDDIMKRLKILEKAN